jgi:hypothetical protein
MLLMYSQMLMMVWISLPFSMPLHPAAQTLQLLGSAALTATYVASTEDTAQFAVGKDGTFCIYVLHA